jgi:hypothetical protein
VAQCSRCRGMEGHPVVKSIRPADPDHVTAASRSLSPQDPCPWSVVTSNQPVIRLRSCSTRIGVKDSDSSKQALRGQSRPSMLRCSRSVTAPERPLSVATSATTSWPPPSARHAMVAPASRAAQSSRQARMPRTSHMQDNRPLPAGGSWIYHGVVGSAVSGVLR